MKTSDSDLKVNRNIYPDAVTCDRMHEKFYEYRILAYGTNPLNFRW